MALIKLMALDEVKQNTQLLTTCCSALIKLLGLEPSAGAAFSPDGSDDEHAPQTVMEYEATYSKLQSTDLPGSKGGLSPDIPDLHQAAQAVLKPQFGQAVRHLAQGNASLSVLAN